MKKGRVKKAIPHIAATVVMKSVATLKPHPRQAQLFDDLPEHSFQELVENIRANKIQIPLEICSDGTIICGHQRYRAAIAIGLTKVPVIVRSDLEALGDQAVLGRLIEDNTARRQLDPLSSARAYQALKSGPRPAWLQGDLRDWLAKKFDCSGRTLDRLVRLLDLPQPIQSAVSTGKLSIKSATGLLQIDRDACLAAAHRIRSGEDPEAVTKELVPKSQPRWERPSESFHRLLRELSRAGAALRHRTAEVASLEADYLDKLRAGQELIKDLIQNVRLVD
jgi:ParB family chromosome partitioning protein